MSYTFTDIVPDRNPNGTNFSDPGLGVAGLRFYKFYFDTLSDTSSCLVRINHMASANTQERILSIYEDGVNINMIDASNIQVNVSITTITNNNIGFTTTTSRTTGDIGFIINNLLPNKRYYIISRTSNNTSSTTADLAVALINNGSTSPIVQLPLTYVETGPIIYNNTIYQTTILTNVIPDTDQNSVALSNPGSGVTTAGAGIRFFRFRFTPTASSCDVYLLTNSTTGAEELINSIYQESNGVNLISTNVTLIAGSGSFFSGSSISLPSTFSGSVLRLTGLEVGQAHSIVFRTNANTTGQDIGCAIFSNNAVLPLTYMETGPVFYNNTFYPSTALTDVIRNSDLSGNNITGAFLNFLRFSFTPTASSCDVYLNTNSNAPSQEIIYSIYNNSDGINLIPTNVTTLLGVSISSSTITLISSVGGLAFRLTGLQAGQTHSIVFRTMNNTSDQDIGCAIFSNNVNLTLTFTGSGPIFYNNTFYLSNIMRDVIPDKDPSDVAVSNPNTGVSGIRFYRFTFIPDASFCDVYLTTTATSSSEEIIQMIYQDSNGINLIPSNVTIVLGVSISSSSITLTSNFSGVAFRLTGLEAGQSHSIIFRTSNNGSGQDVGCVIFSNNNSLPLTYVGTGPLFYNNTFYPTTILKDVIPDKDQNDVALTNPGIGAGIRIFKFSFTPNSSSCDVYLTTNSSVLAQEKIMRIYQDSNEINLIPSNVTTILGVGIYDSSIILTNSFSGVAFRLTGLQAGQTHSIIFRTNSNTSGQDVGCAIFSNNEILPLTYVGTGPVFYNNNFYPDSVITNVIPDTDVNGTTLSNPGTNSGVRFFKYRFTPDASSCDIYLNTTGIASTEETFQMIYDDSNKINLIPTNVTPISGVSISNSTITLVNNFSGLAFRLTGLQSGQPHSIILRTSFNDSGQDVGCAIFSNNAVLPLTYIQTGVFLFNNDIIPHTNVIPDVDPSGNTLSAPGIAAGIRFFKYNFTANASSCDVYLHTNSSSSLDESIQTIYQESDGINLIPSNVSIVSGVSFLGSSILLTYSSALFNGLAFSLNGLQAGQVYSIIFKTYNNDSNQDLGCLILSNNTILPLSYVQTGQLIINNTIIPFTNVIPDVNTNGATLSNPSTGSGERFFKFSFVPNASSCDVCLNTNSSALNEELIQLIYKDSEKINLIPTNVTPISGVSISASSITLINSFIGIAFKLTGLEIGQSYSIIFRTTNNQADQDVGCSIFSNNTILPLTYIKTGATIINNEVYSPTNVIPDNDVNGAILSNPVINTIGDRFFRFSFVPESTSCDVYLITNQYASGEELIQMIYEDSNKINLIPSNITIISGASISGTTISVTNTFSGLAFRLTGLQTGQTHSIIFKTTYNDSGQDVGCLIFSNNTDLSLTYIETGPIFYNSTIYSSSIFTNVVPDFDPSGTVMSTNSSTQFFRFSFIPNSSSCIVFLNTNTTALSQELIQTIYKDSNKVNLIATNVTPISGVNISNSNITLTNSFIGVAFTLSGLDVGESYSIIFKTTSNTPGQDVGCAFLSNNVILPLTYVQSGTFFINNTLISLRNVIPDFDMNNVALSNPTINSSATRYFKFRFTPDASSCDVYLSTNSAALSQEIILNIYQDSNEINLIPNNITTISGVSTSGSTITLTNSFNGLAFRLTGLEPGQSHSIIFRTSLNNTGEDIGCALLSNDIVLPLSYIQTGSVFYNNNIYEGNTLTNVIPDFDPSGNMLTNPTIITNALRFFRFRFTPDASSCDVYLSTNSSVVTQEIIYSIYRDSNIINLISTNVTPISGVSISNSTINLTSLFNGLAFRLTGLEAGQSYSIIFRTNFNHSGQDIGCAIFSNNIVLPLTYVGTGPVFYNNTFYPSTILKDVIPDKDQNDIPLTNPGTGAGTRYFKFNFTPDASSCDVYLNTNSFASSDEIIQNIYNDSNGINLIPTNVTPVLGVSISNSTITLTFLFGGVAFRLTGLQPGYSHSIIFKTTNNDVGQDIGCTIFSNNIPLNLSYLATSINDTELINIVPGPPNITSIDFTDNSVTINFTPGNNEGPTAIIKYQTTVNGGISWQDTNPLIPSGSYTISGLSNTQIYNVGLRAISQDGNGISAFYPTPVKLISQFIINLSPSAPKVILNNIQSANINENTLFTNLPEIFNVQSLPTEQEKRIARKNLINAIFDEKASLNRIKVPRQSLGLPSQTIAKENVIVLRKAVEVNETPIILDPIISPSTSVYLTLDNIGDSKLFTFGNNNFSVVKTNSSPEQFTLTNLDTSSSTVYSENDVVSIAGLDIQFGSVTISESPPAPLPHVPIEVDFNIDMTANNAFTIFGEETAIPDQNVIVPIRTLPVNTLYDISENKGLIEFEGNVSNDEDILCRLAGSSNGDWIPIANKFVKGIHKLLCDEFDCSQASPFNNDIYKNNDGDLEPRYFKQRDFSRVAMASLSHFIFGHVDATAAISNDKQFMKNILSITDDTAGNSSVSSPFDLNNASNNRTAADARYTAWKYASELANPTSQSWIWNNPVETTDDAVLAFRVGRTLIKKGQPTQGVYLTESIIDASNSSIARIVSQVITQDSSRAVKLEGGINMPGVPQPLRFYPDDIIYINIRVRKPIININSNKVNEDDIDNRYPESAEKIYTLKITLGQADETL